MRARRGSWVVVVTVLVVGMALAGPARAGKAKGGKADEVRELLDKAAAAFALNRYPVAAENYEKAFELKPDPAVLYNAAQAHRLAGNKQRALELYQSYLRMYGSEKRAEVEKHVEDLKAAIEKDRAVATAPPQTPAPVGGTTTEAATPPPTVAPAKAEPPPAAVAKAEAPAPVATPPPAPPPPAPVETKPVLVSQPAPADDDRSIVTRPWFWIVVGGVVAAAVVGGLLLARKEPVDPTASLGSVPGNGN
jgi:hypothetical protein